MNKNCNIIPYINTVIYISICICANIILIRYIMLYGMRILFKNRERKKKIKQRVVRSPIKTPVSLESDFINSILQNIYTKFILHCIQSFGYKTQRNFIQYQPEPNHESGSHMTSY